MLGIFSFFFSLPCTLFLHIFLPETGIRLNVLTVLSKLLALEPPFPFASPRQVMCATELRAGKGREEEEEIIHPTLPTRSRILKWLLKWKKVTIKRKKIKKKIKKNTKGIPTPCPVRIMMSGCNPRTDTSSSCQKLIRCHWKAETTRREAVVLSRPVLCLRKVSWYPLH